MTLTVSAVAGTGGLYHESGQDVNGVGGVPELRLGGRFSQPYQPGGSMDHEMYNTTYARAGVCA